MSTEDLQQSPLHAQHVQLKARLIDFHGWELPVQYTSIIDEHKTVRTAAGMFDISHMGQVIISGPQALPYLQNLTTSNMQRTLDKGVGVYAHLLRPNGKVIDDIFVYGMPGGEEFFLVVNGSTHEKDVKWFRENATEGVSIIDLEHRGGFAIQGPKALAIIRKTIPGISELPRFGFQRISGETPEDSMWGCRTGYTGEEGAEFFGPAKSIELLWKELMDNGAEMGIKPCGLGARDTLRLEMGYPLYGNELTEKRTSLEAGMEWAVKWDKGDFIGRDALEKQKAAGLTVKLLAYELTDRGIPRGGAEVFRFGEPGGVTTSGTFSPSLQKGIGLAYAPISWNNPGTVLEVDIHGKRIPAKVVALPFYRKP